MKAQTPATQPGRMKPEGEYNKLARNANFLRLAGELLIFFLFAGAAAIAFFVDNPGPLPLPFGGTIDIPSELSGALGGTHGLVHAHGFLEQNRLLPRDNLALAILTIPIFLSGLLGVLRRRWPAVLGPVIVLAAISWFATGAPRFQATGALNLLIVLAGLRYALIERTLLAALLSAITIACLYSSPFHPFFEEVKRKQSVQDAIIAEKSAMNTDLKRTLASHLARSTDNIEPHVNYVLAQLAYHNHKRAAALSSLRKLESSTLLLTTHSVGRLQEIRGFASQSANAAAKADDNYAALYVVAVATLLVIAISFLLKGQADAILRRIERLRSSAARLSARRTAPRSSIDEASLHKLKRRELTIRRAALGCLMFAGGCVFVGAESGYHLFWSGGAISDITLSSYAFQILQATSRDLLQFRQSIAYGTLIFAAAFFAALGFLIYTIAKSKRRSLIPLLAVIGLGQALELNFRHFNQVVLPGGHVGRAHVDPKMQLDIEKLGRLAEGKTPVRFRSMPVNQKIVAADVHLAIAQLAYLRDTPAIGAYHFRKFAEISPDGNGFASHTLVRLHTWLRDSGHAVDLPLRPARLRAYRATSTATIFQLLISLPAWLFGLVGLAIAEMIRRNHRRIDALVRAEVSVDRVQNWLASRDGDRSKSAMTMR